MVIVVRGRRERNEGVESQMELVCLLSHSHYLKTTTEMTSHTNDHCVYVYSSLSPQL